MHQTGMAVGGVPAEPEGPVGRQAVQYPTVDGRQGGFIQAPLNALVIDGSAIAIPAGEPHPIGLVNPIGTHIQASKPLAAVRISINAYPTIEDEWDSIFLSRVATRVLNPECRSYRLLVAMNLASEERNKVLMYEKEGLVDGIVRIAHMDTFDLD